MSVEGPVQHGRSVDRTRGFVLVAVMIALMWVLEIADAAGAHLDGDGIRPRDPGALPGIALAPFLHAGWGHLIGNTIPFAILGAVIALGGLARVALVTVIVTLIGGLGTWLTAASGTVTIGASGLVFGFAAYLVVRGAFSRRPLHLIAGLFVLAVYGTTLAFSLIPHPGVSWQAHVFGALGGVVAARLLDRRTPRRLAPAGAAA
jgi:membrane associated rhomboid family serine protease